MAKGQGASSPGNGHAEEGHPEMSSEETHASESPVGADDFMVKAATVGVIGLGVALFEAALIPGMIIGVAAMLAPKALPKLGATVEPAFRCAVRGAYRLGQRTRHVVAEAQEQIRDIAVETAAEGTPSPKL